MVGSKYLCNIHIMLIVSSFAEHIYPSLALKGEWCIQTNPTKMACQQAELKIQY